MHVPSIEIPARHLKIPLCREKVSACGLQMYRRAVHDSSRMRAMLFSTGLLLRGMVAVSSFGGGAIAVYMLNEPFKVHAPRPVLNVLISVSDGNSIYTINGVPAYTFKDDTAFSPPKGDNDYMKSYPLEGSTLVCFFSYSPCSWFACHKVALTIHQVSNAHIDGTFTHVINGIGLPLYTRLPEGQDSLAVFNALNEYYAPAFSTANIEGYSSRLPALGSSWIYQPFVNGTRPIDASADVAVYDVDLRDVSPQQISALKSAGSVVMCRIIAGAALEQSAGSDSVVLGDAVLPKSSTVGQVPGKSGEHFLNIGLPSVKEAVVTLIKRAASSGCDGVEYMRTQFTSYQFAAIAKPEELAYHQWLTQNAHSQNVFSVLRNEGSLTASYASSYDVLVQQNVFSRGLACALLILICSNLTHASDVLGQFC
jgi:hypothetical protein